MSSVLEYPDLQLRINDNDSGSKFQSFDVNLYESYESNSSKENQSPVLIKSPTMIKPLHPTSSVENPQLKSNKIAQKSGNDGIKIDLEIQEIEKELNRLSLRLDSLRTEKSEKITKMVEQQKGRIFKPVKNSGFSNKIEEKTTFSVTSSTSVEQKGTIFTPVMIKSWGFSNKIEEKTTFSDFGSRRLSNVLHTTPVSKQSRRKSCYWKLNEIDELKVTKEKGGNKIPSISPKSRKTGSKTRENGVSTLIKPKKLFNVEKTDTDKKIALKIGDSKALENGVSTFLNPVKLFYVEKTDIDKKTAMKTGRVVASRYNKEGDGEKNDEKNTRENASELRALRGMVSRVKKRWEIPSELVLCREKSSSPNSEFNDLLPRIKTVRCTKASPRDSGGVKRVADLVGKKSYFESSFDQALNFEDDDEEIVYTGKGCS